jgi:hypothetical protein
MSRTDTSNEAILNLAAQLGREEATQFLAETLRALLFDREMLRGERDSARAMAEDIRLDMQKDMSSLELTIAWLQDEREELRAALRGLLADTQHVRHHCEDHDCPVEAARAALGEDRT